MSAFGGFCFWDGQPVLRNRLSMLSEHLQIAGPNGSRTLQPEPWLALQSHQLHFDRLSTNEEQPFTFAQGSVLSWDGRLDNREDLLVSLHHDLGVDESDAALVAAAYERWGVDALPRLLGDWCLALWDAPHQRLVLARDYMGNRPLYYLAEPERLVWATRLEALAASENLFGTPDDTYIAAFLTTGAPHDQAPFVGVSTLVAGHVLIGTRDGISVQRYWKYSPTTLRYRELDQYADHLRLLLTEAVRVRLRASRTVWVHLSGGWDSSAVVCIAHGLVARRCVETPAIRPLSIVYDDPEAAGERRFIAAVEHWCGIETTTQSYRGRPTFAEMLGHRVPVPNHEGYDLEAPAQIAGDRIALTGWLGDLATGQGGGPLLPMWEQFNNGHPLRAMRSIAAYARASKYPLARMLLNAALDRFGASRARARRASTAGWSLRHASTPGMEAIPAELLRRVQARQAVAQPSSAEFPRTQQRLVDSLYSIADKGMRGDFEFFTPVIWKTHPFTHRPLIEFLLAIPRGALFDPLFVRAGMRRALVDILPPAILERTTKVGIHPTALRRWRRRQAELMKDAPPLTDAITDWCLVQRGVVNATTLAQDVRNMRAGARPSDFLYRSLHIEAWLRSLVTPPASVRSTPLAVTETSERVFDAVSDLSVGRRASQMYRPTTARPALDAPRIDGNYAKGGEHHGL